MAAALVLGFRATPAWAFVGLAKVTTGVVGLWPLLRREWWTVLVLAATVAIVCIPSLFLAPGLWGQWIEHLLVRGAEPNLWGAEIGIPLVLPLRRRGAPDRLGLPAGSPLGPRPCGHAGPADPVVPRAGHPHGAPASAPRGSRARDAPRWPAAAAERQDPIPSE